MKHFFFFFLTVIYLFLLNEITSLKFTKKNLLFIYSNFDLFNNKILNSSLNTLKNKRKTKLKILSSPEKDEEIYYELNHENVEKVLNLIRPKLQIDNGDVELVKIKNNDLYIRLLGNCVTCSSNSVTVSQVIKKTLKKYIRNEKKEEPNVIITNFDEINKENIQNCLNQLKPYFDFLKVEIIIKDIVINKENINNSVSLKFQNFDDSEEIKIPFNIKNEVTERLKQKFPTLTVNFEN
ncbi:Fe-S-cluster redox enzyme, putative [Plasmodium gallinaceum]|uniref:Fe-S-cluster redox enzyme, putative n=1 Tax=Plasmodium gallinaceum TaxID=5849 RepID=A0A1J1GZN2_PLAGA|nr:Fe-S-cluster redox enzyme, putative [Plasmodium gallinaceum]CRG96761.1 Fe-S-cluster redox enzyme, putative [Plasmodium gallinaceum]